MAELQRSLSSSLPATSNQYTDILLLGKTGMGKSTTADKLLTANPYGQQYVGTTQGNPEAQELEGGQIKIEDLSLWRLSGRHNVEQVTDRIKRILLQRSTGETIYDPCREDGESVTNECELLANEKTRIRVLDVPGFFSSSSLSTSPPENTDGSSDLDACALNQKQYNLGVMRQILRIQAEKNLVFRRILYFLPCRGALERADSIVQSELRLLSYFFGMSIFDSMIVIMTLPFDYSHKNAISKRSLDVTRRNLRKAFQLSFNIDASNEPHRTPDTPLFYVSLEESGTDILKGLYSQMVANPRGLKLKFQKNACARCALQFGELNKKKVVCTVHDNGRKDTIMYDESKCHPLIKSKFTKLQRFAGGIAYVLLLGIPYAAGAKWPGFFNSDEECPNCYRAPGTPGCMKVHKTYHETIIVDHKSELDAVVVYNPELDANIICDPDKAVL